MPVVQERVVAPLPFWDDVRFDLPERDVRFWERLQLLQHQLRDVQRDCVDVPDVPCEPALPCAEHVDVR